MRCPSVLADGLAHGHVADEDDGVFRPHGCRPVLVEAGIHLLRRRERPLRVADDVGVAEVQIGPQPDVADGRQAPRRQGARRPQHGPKGSCCRDASRRRRALPRLRAGRCRSSSAPRVRQAGAGSRSARCSTGCIRSGLGNAAPVGCGTGRPARAMAGASPSTSPQWASCTAERKPVNSDVSALALKAMSGARLVRCACAPSGPTASCQTPLFQGVSASSAMPMASDPSAS